MDRSEAERNALDVMPRMRARDAAKNMGIEMVVHIVHAYLLLNSLGEFTILHIVSVIFTIYGHIDCSLRARSLTSSLAGLSASWRARSRLS